MEARLYNKTEKKYVHCFLCAHHCKIADGKRGICGVRENKGSTLSTLVYGKVIAEHIDPIEKKPFFQFQPGSRSYSIATVGCNFRCLHCMKFAKGMGLKNTFVTNGFMTKECLDEIKGLLDAANVDVKAFTEEFYKRVCGARLAPVL